MSRFQLRRDRLRRRFKKSGVREFLVTDFTNVSYLTGFSGDDSFLIFLDDREVMLSDPRYTTQLQEECPGLALEIRSPGTAMFQSIRKILGKSRQSNVGFESGGMTVQMHQRLVEEVPKVEWVGCGGLVESLRVIKDREEVRAIRNAVDLAQRAFAVTRCSLRGDQTEQAALDTGPVCSNHLPWNVGCRFRQIDTACA